MEQINRTELCDPNIYPNEEILKDVLGLAYETYSKLLNIFAVNGMIGEWRYYNDGKAWLCKVQKKKKTIVWMSAWKGFMKATIYSPDRYTDSLCGLPIQNETKERIRTNMRVGKTVPCMFELRNKEVLEDFQTIMHFKISLK